ncbi:MAG: tRNA threonylcarbamoyladenosine dehydratase [Pseudoflavonifractor sp.]|nr:tRNA threonylcarbamoyladenosine dehydratase [Pseudoflavonifractor sp.]
MSLDSFHRTRLMMGDEAMERLAALRVVIFGLGGVGSWCAESLVRSGVGHITLVDFDTVDITNLNRQLPALASTVGSRKVEVVRSRLLDINPEADIVAVNGVYTAATAADYDLDSYDYVVDAIDSLSDKALLILRATASRARLVSSMGAALKLDPSRIAVAEFWRVKGCPLAASLRRYFKRHGEFPRRKFKCVYSDEIVPNRIVDTVSPLTVDAPEGASASGWQLRKARINGTVAHTTAIFGFTLAGIIIRDIYG